MKPNRLSVRKSPSGAQHAGLVISNECTAEQRAAAEFVAGLQRAGVDLTNSSACDDILVPPLAAAGMLGIKRQTLALWRCQRSQPLRYVKVGRRVLYHLGDLRRFIASRSTLPAQAA